MPTGAGADITRGGRRAGRTPVDIEAPWLLSYRQGDAGALGGEEPARTARPFRPGQLERDMDNHPTDWSLNDINRKTALTAALLMGVGGLVGGVGLLVAF